MTACRTNRGSAARATTAVLLALLAGGGCGKGKPVEATGPRPDPDPATIRAMGDRELWEYSLAKVAQHLEAEQEKDRMASARALVVLTAAGDVGAKDVLLDKLQRGSVAAQVALLTTFASTARVAKSPLEADDVVHPVLAAAGASDLQVRRAAVAALGTVARTSAAARDALLIAMRDADTRVRISALEAAGKIGIVGAVPLLRAALMDSNEAVVSAAAVSLAVISGERSVEALVPLLSDPRSSVRAQACIVVASLMGADAREMLEERLADPSPRVRYAAAKSLAEALGTGAAAPIAGLLVDGDAGVRAEAAYLLGLIGGGEQELALRKAMKDADPRVRAEAERALTRVRMGVGIGSVSMGGAGTMSRHAAYDALASGTSGERIGALGSLGRSGNRGDLELIRQGLWHEDIEVRVAAARAVREIILRFPLRGDGASRGGGELERF